MLAIDPETGATRWDVLLPSRIQSSPIVIGKTLYVGSDKGLLFALDTSDGHRRWAFRAPHPIESSPSFDSGRIYAADYGGNIYALDASSGRRIWRADTTKLGPGGSGGFYSSPAVAGGRVYVARDDGTVYAVDAQRGRYEWSFEAGRFIYGSPAVAAVRGTPLTVYVGSYDGTLYALDAGSGKVRWRYRVGGPVPGTATVIGRTVYTSSFKTRKTVGVDAITHRRTFEFESPGYTPMVSDGERLYLAGYSSLHAFVPR